jgi:molecular chaperone HtpG
MADAVTHSFQADVAEVLNLVIHSLYAHADVFLRELISNASDALDRLRFRALTDPELTEGDATMVIRILPDAERRTLTIEDTGIGMTEEELVKSLGTIAHSGSRAFLERLAQQGQPDARLIGQFGVGFYSAFLVAERVDVVSRAAGAGQTGHVWMSNGRDTFTVAPADRSERGTAVVVHLRDDQREFLEPWRLRQLVERYSDYVSHPIQLRVTKGSGEQATTAFETVNRASALWQRPKAEISEEQYDEFYRHLARGDGEKPIARTHFKIEGTREFTGLIYIPRERPFELRFGARHRGLRLYVKRILVMDDCDEIVPEWLRFVVGVVDSDDLPLNVSREVLQESSVVRAIKKQIVKRVLDTLDEMAEQRPDDYAAFFNAFGSFLKSGVATDFESRDRVAKLLRYESTDGVGLVSLSDYVKRMKDQQPAIYFAIGESRQGLESAPHLEVLRSRGYEVLLMTDPVDEWVTTSLGTFEGKPLVSAMRAELTLADEDGDKSEKEARARAVGPLMDRIRSVLGDRVFEVRASDRLIDSPCCLVIRAGSPHGYVERLLRQSGGDVSNASRILEINPRHAIVMNLTRLLGRGDDRVDGWIELLYEQALIAGGASLANPSGFVRRVTALLESVTGPATVGPGGEPSGDGSVSTEMASS